MNPADRDPGQNGIPFKTCTVCKQVWKTRAAFLADPSVLLIGYQAFLPEPELGLFMFNHEVCKTTLALQAEVFQDLYDGPVYTERLTHTEACCGYCDDEGELRRCPEKCECAWVREILQIVRQWPKNAPAVAS